MEILIGLVILILALVIASMLSQGGSKKKKYIIWGITTMIAVAPLFSWIIAILYVYAFGADGFAGIGLLMILAPLLFVVGLVILLVGVFTKAKTDSL